MSFSSLALDPAILSALESAKYKKPTPIQAGAIPPILAGKDLIGIAQTGTGKTAAFTLPLLTLLNKRKPKNPGIRALVIAPTRELVTQIVDNVQKYSAELPFQTLAIYGGVGEGPQIEGLNNGAEIVVATPGRFIDLLDQGYIDLRGTECLVLDEADRMLDMGFLPPIRKIVRKLPVDRQTLLFSATLSKQIEKLSQEFLSRPNIIEIGNRTNPAKTVRQCIHNVPRHLKYPLLCHLLEDQALFSVLVFCSMKHQANRIATSLKKLGHEADAIHGDRTQNQRQRALDKFKNAKLRVLVATDVAARGLDISGVTHVINYDFPGQVEDYIHRIGRTGRAGSTGDAITFVDPSQRRDLNLLEKHIKVRLKEERAEGFDYFVPAPVKNAHGQKPKRNGQRPQTRKKPNHQKRKR